MLPCVFGLSGLTLSADERAFIREADPAGFILYGRNVAAKTQLRALTDELRAVTGRPDLLIMADQEGGRIARLRPPTWPAAPAPWRFAELYAVAPITGMEAARVNALATALMLSEAGINVNCAPVLDLHHPDTHPVIGERALGSDAMQVASLGRAVLDGLAAGGVAGVLKHMPGHGRARADSHRELPVVAADADALEVDLAPFRSLAGRARIAMTAHVLFPAWDPQWCATLSPFIIRDIIRSRIGFDGLLVSDDIIMDALAGSLASRAAAAIGAGCDLVLQGSGVLADNVGVAAALPVISDHARERLGAAVPAQPSDPLPDLGDLLAKREALLRIVSNPDRN